MIAALLFWSFFLLCVFVLGFLTFIHLLRVCSPNKYFNNLWCKNHKVLCDPATQNCLLSFDLLVKFSPIFQHEPVCLQQVRYWLLRITEIHFKTSILWGYEPELSSVGPVLPPWPLTLLAVWLFSKLWWRGAFITTDDKIVFCWSFALHVIHVWNYYSSNKAEDEKDLMLDWCIGRHFL